jgi:arsenate reductase
MTPLPVVLFLCTHNAGRSVAARVLLDHYANGRIDVRSAGSEPADQLNPSVVALLKERGLDPKNEHPKLLSIDDGLDADVIVTMGCGDTCPVYPGRRYLDWELADPAGQPIEGVRPIVEDIDQRVQSLLAELVGSVQLEPEGHPKRQRIPVACTLDQTDGEERIDKWRGVFKDMVTGAERPRDGQLRLSLADDPNRLSELIALAQAEKNCCSFFEFTLAIDADAITLIVDVPIGSESVLDDLAHLADAT